MGQRFGLGEKPDITEKDKKEIAELLLQEVELKYRDKQKIPSRGELAVLAAKNFPIPVMDAPSCVDVMERQYTDKLKDMGYRIKK